MAFHQPTIQHSQKKSSNSLEETYLQLAQLQQPPIQQQLTDSQEWILFDPSPLATLKYNFSTPSVRTLTAGYSQISDLGSFKTKAWSHNDEEVLEDEDKSENYEEDGELDSLDSHLLEFRSESRSFNDPEPEPSGTILPTHDGLGSFKLNPTAVGDDIQQHLYTFEKYNPQRCKRRRENLNLDSPEHNVGQAQESEWLRRIESWREEQSRVLFNEIQRESLQEKQNIKCMRENTRENVTWENMATLKIPSNKATENENENESFLNRITRKVIQDLIGIDDDILSIIFGESLAYELDQYSIPIESYKYKSENKSHKENSWDHKIFERITRELGILANKLSDHRAGLNDHLPTPSVALSYADIPIASDRLDAQSMSERSAKSKKKSNLRPTNRTWRVSVPTGPAGGGKLSPYALGVQLGCQAKKSRGSSRCADERETSVYSGDSRNYWDWTDSVSSHKTTPGTGVMESWGEV